MGMWLSSYSRGVVLGFSRMTRGSLLVVEDADFRTQPLSLVNWCELKTQSLNSRGRWTNSLRRRGSGPLQGRGYGFFSRNERSAALGFMKGLGSMDAALDSIRMQTSGRSGGAVLGSSGLTRGSQLLDRDAALTQ